MPDSSLRGAGRWPDSGTMTSPGDQKIAGINFHAPPPNQEDARRRFLLALRGMTVRRQRDEQNRKAVEEWTQKLEEEIANYRVYRRRRFWRLVARLVFLVLLGFLFFRNGQFWWIWMFFIGGAAADVASSSRTQLATTLARARDPRAVNALASACMLGDSETRRICKQGLVSLLPSMRADEAEFVTADGMRHLIDLLRSRDPALVVAILRCFEQIGDARALPAVSRLADSRLDSFEARLYPHPGFEEILEAAKHCLPFLEAAAERDRQRDLLLRPASSAPEDANLLRPAGFSANESPEHLLRPAAETAEAKPSLQVEDQPVVSQFHASG